MLSSFTYRITLPIPEDPDNEVGLNFNNDLIITKPSSNPDIAKCIYFGDLLLSLDGVELREKGDYEAIITKLAGSSVEFTFQRINTTSPQVFPLHCLNAERQSRLNLSRGYLYFAVDIIQKEEANEIGLFVKHHQNRVIVTKIKPNTLTSDYLVGGDIILDVDGIRVSDKKVLCNLVIANLKRYGRCNLIIQRPNSVESENWSESAMIAFIDTSPSVKMLEDVQRIAGKIRKELILKKGVERDMKSILVKHGENKDYNEVSRVTFNDDKVIFDIASDASGGTLRKVKRSAKKMKRTRSKSRSYIKNRY
uniref:PDZ domain-containing protein n=1 Tax=Rhabditophanes sp. KR3021 TaxID=114890 RepID=A0AC35U1R3_9BILA